MTHRPPALPWSCQHFRTRSVVRARRDAASPWLPVAEIRASAEVNPRATARFITACVNSHAPQQGLIDELVKVLETCLEQDRLGWTAEHDAEVVLRRARQSSNR